MSKGPMLSPADGWKLALERIESDLKILEQLDAKFGVVAGFALTSVAEVLGLLLLGILEGERSPGSLPLVVVLLSVAGLFLAFGAACVALRGLWPQPHDRGPDISMLIQEISENGLRQMIITAANRNKQIRKKKSSRLKSALSLTVLAVAFYTAAAVFVLFSTRGNKAASGANGSSSAVRPSVPACSDQPVQPLPGSPQEK